MNLRSNKYLFRRRANQDKATASFCVSEYSNTFCVSLSRREAQTTVFSPYSITAKGLTSNASVASKVDLLGVNGTSVGLQPMSSIELRKILLHSLIHCYSSDD